MRHLDLFYAKFRLVQLYFSLHKNGSPREPQRTLSYAERIIDL